MKGVIYIDMCGYRGLGRGLIEYIKKNTSLIGENNSINNFDIQNNKLMYKDKEIYIDNFSHVMFTYKCDELDINTTRNKNLIEKFEKFKKLEKWLIENTDLIIINKISNSIYDTYRDKFFNKLKNIVNIPEYRIINNLNDLNDIDDGKYILRTLSDCCSYNFFFVDKNNINKWFKYLKNKTNDKLILINYYNPYIEELKCNVTARVFMKRDYIDIVTIDPFHKELFSHRQKNKEFNYIEIDSNYNRISTSKLEHIKKIKTNNLIELHTKCYEFIYNYIKKFYNDFKNMQKHINLDIISVDFLPLKNGPLFLEVGIKNGLSIHKCLPIINTTSNIISNKYKDYLNDNKRNEIIYKQLFKKYNLFCDIDNTICDSIPRLKNSVLNNGKLSNLWMNKECMLKDNILDNSNFYLNLLNKKYNIIFITARKNITNHKEITELWLKNNNFLYDNIIYTKSLEDKIKYLNNSDLFIDDCSKGHHTNKIFLQDDIIKKIKLKKIILEIYDSKNNNWEMLYNKYKN